LVDDRVTPVIEETQPIYFPQPSDPNPLQKPPPNGQIITAEWFKEAFETVQIGPTEAHRCSRDAWYVYREARDIDDTALLDALSLEMDSSLLERYGIPAVWRAIYLIDETESKPAVFFWVDIDPQTGAVLKAEEVIIEE
jgi:hypothetical protein